MTFTDGRLTQRPKASCLLVFMVLWPPTGLLVFLLLMSANASVDQADWNSPANTAYTLILIISGSFISGIPTSYILGIIPAFAAGKITSMILKIGSRFEIVLVALTGLLTGIAYWLFIRVTSGDPISAEWTANGSCNYVIVCLVPTMICWLLARKPARKRV